MIVKGMNYEEILKECFEDLCDCAPRAFKILNNDKKLKKFIMNLKRSCLRQHPKKYYFKYFTLISKNNNTVLILPSYDMENKEFGLYNLVLYNFGSGFYVVEPINLGIHHKIYTPHFFDRFRERELKNPTLSKFDVISEFYKIRNAYRLPSDYSTVCRRTVRSVEMLPEKVKEKYPENSYIEPYGNRGLIILECLEKLGIDIVKTYLNFDILKDNQIDALTDLVQRSDIIV